MGWDLNLGGFCSGDYRVAPDFAHATSARQCCRHEEHVHPLHDGAASTNEYVYNTTQTEHSALPKMASGTRYSVVLAEQQGLLVNLWWLSKLNHVIKFLE